MVRPVIPTLPVPGGYPGRRRADTNDASANDGRLLCSWPTSTNESWATFDGSSRARGRESWRSSTLRPSWSRSWSKSLASAGRSPPQSVSTASPVLPGAPTLYLRASQKAAPATRNRGRQGPLWGSLAGLQCTMRARKIRRPRTPAFSPRGADFFYVARPEMGADWFSAAFISRRNSGSTGTDGAPSELPVSRHSCRRLACCDPAAGRDDIRHQIRSRLAAERHGDPGELGRTSAPGKAEDRSPPSDQARRGFRRRAREIVKPATARTSAEGSGTALAAMRKSGPR